MLFRVCATSENALHSLVQWLYLSHSLTAVSASVRICADTGSRDTVWKLYKQKEGSLAFRVEIKLSEDDFRDIDFNSRIQCALKTEKVSRVRMRNNQPQNTLFSMSKFDRVGLDN